MEKFKKLSLSVLVSTILISFMLILVFKSDADISKSERRKLLKAPTFSVQKVFDKRYFPNYEKYLLDQFPFREQMRGIKALTAFNLLRKNDNDGIFCIADNIFKIDDALDERQVSLAAKKINGIIENHPEANYFYTLIPDKNCFVADYPGLDCKKLLSVLQSKISAAHYIDIANLMSLDDYYRTDPHWSSAKIEKVAQKICTEINGAYHPLQNPQKVRLPGFYGAYYGQLALALPSENMDYIDSPSFAHVKVSSIEKDKHFSVYDTTNFTNVDPYDFFLGGAQAILYVENEHAKTDRELILFRDSFGSSLAPLMVENYKKISLVDIRYISTKSAAKYLNFDQTDVLFMYSSRLYNNGGILR